MNLLVFLRVECESGLGATILELLYGFLVFRNQQFVMKKCLNNNDGIIRVTYLFNLAGFAQCEDDSRRAIPLLPTVNVDGEPSTKSLLPWIEDRELLVAIGERITYINIIMLIILIQRIPTARI